MCAVIGPRLKNALLSAIVSFPVRWNKFTRTAQHFATAPLFLVTQTPFYCYAVLHNGKLVEKHHAQKIILKGERGGGLVAVI
jgi:hypothetical protein